MVNRIKDLRQKEKMKQSDLAVILNCTATAISNYETGYRSLDVETIHKLCDIFGCTADYLLGRSEQTAPDLTDEEARLIAAFREADEDARAMVLLALKKWMPPIGETKDAAS